MWVSMQAVFISELLENRQAIDTFLYSHMTHMFYFFVQRERDFHLFSGCISKENMFCTALNIAIEVVFKKTHRGPERCPSS